jgi:hypothetical protein
MLIGSREGQIGELARARRVDLRPEFQIPFRPVALLIRAISRSLIEMGAARVTRGISAS